MNYSLRRTWPRSDHRENDFVVRYRGASVGRMYLTQLLQGECWRWAIYINAKVRIVAGVPFSGIADDLETAKEEFRENFEQMRRSAKFLSN